MLPRSITHDEDMQTLIDYMEVKSPGLEPHTSLWKTLAALHSMGDVKFPEHVRYLLARPMTSIDMKQRADRVYGPAMLLNKAKEAESGRS